MPISDGSSIVPDEIDISRRLLCLRRHIALPVLHWVPGCGKRCCRGSRGCGDSAGWLPRGRIGSAQKGPDKAKEHARSFSARWRLDLCLQRSAPHANPVQDLQVARPHQKIPTLAEQARTRRDRPSESASRLGQRGGQRACLSCARTLRRRADATGALGVEQKFRLSDSLCASPSSSSHGSNDVDK